MIFSSIILLVSASIIRISAIVYTIPPEALTLCPQLVGGFGISGSGSPQICLWDIASDFTQCGGVNVDDTLFGFALDPYTGDGWIAGGIPGDPIDLYRVNEPITFPPPVGGFTVTFVSTINGGFNELTFDESCTRDSDFLVLGFGPPGGPFALSAVPWIISLNGPDPSLVIFDYVASFPALDWQGEGITWYPPQIDGQPTIIYVGYDFANLNVVFYMLNGTIASSQTVEYIDEAGVQAAQYIGGGYLYVTLTNEQFVLLSGVSPSGGSLTIEEASATNSWPFSFPKGLSCYNPQITCVSGGSGGGDPHYKSLDGLKFKYDGPCSYLLSSNDCNNDNNNNNNNNFTFKIIGHHGRCRSRRKKNVCLKRLTIYLDNNIIEMGDNNEVRINNKIEKIILDKPAQRFILNENKMITIGLERYSDVRDDVNDNLTYFRYHIIATDWGINMYFGNKGTGMANIVVKEGINTCGMLGNNDGNYKNDIMLKNGNILQENTQENINMMGDSWYVYDEREPLSCKWYPDTSFISSQKCNNNQIKKETIENLCDNMLKEYLHSLGGKNVDKCFSSFIDATRIWDDCITEICNDNNQNLQLSEPKLTLDLFKSTCETNGVLYFPFIPFADIINKTNIL